MLAQIMYYLHYGIMLGIVITSALMFLKKGAEIEVKKKIAKYFLAFTHSQFLIGMIYFFMRMQEGAHLNHMKIGIKILLLIELIIVATIYKKKLGGEKPVSPVFLLIILINVFAIIAMVFLWK